MSQTEVALIKALSVLTGDIADQAVTLDKLPHGTSSNDGKFLRANNGADPTFETISAPDLSNLNASNLTSGTVPDARFPATLPAISGANLTNLPGGGKVTRVFTNSNGTQYANHVNTTYLTVTVTSPPSSDYRYLLFISYNQQPQNSSYPSIANISTTNASVSGYNFTQTVSSSTLQSGFLFDSASNTSNRTYSITHRASSTDYNKRSILSGGIMVVLELDAS